MQKYHNLEDGTYELKAEHAEDCAKKLAGSFSKRNVVWAEAGLELLKLKQFFYKTIMNHLHFQHRLQKSLGRKVFLNTILVDDGYLSSCSLHYDIEDYRVMLKEKGVAEIPIFQSLEKQGAKLVENLDLKSYETGKALYWNFGSRSTSQRSPLLSSLHCLAEMYIVLQTQGYRYAMGRISNDILKAYYVELGAQIISSIGFNVGKGKKQTLYFAVMDFENEIFKKVAEDVKKFREGQRKGSAKL